MDNGEDDNCDDFVGDDDDVVDQSMISGEGCHHLPSQSAPTHATQSSESSSSSSSAGLSTRQLEFAKSAWAQNVDFSLRGAIHLNISMWVADKDIGDWYKSPFVRLMAIRREKCCVVLCRRGRV